MVFSLFRRNPAAENARKAYIEIAEHARTPAFFSEMGAPDTVDGRFEVLSAMMYLALRRLKGHGREAEDFSQRLFDMFFQNMDDALRELGVGDMSIGRKIRGLAEAFYGRVGAYEAAMAADAAPAALEDALARNVYHSNDPAQAKNLATYIRAADAALRAAELPTLLAGRIALPDPASFHPVREEKSA